MNAERLFAEFHRLTEVPDAVPRLRRFILDLAVRGRVVGQDPSEETAVQLLSRIQSARARLVQGRLLRGLVLRREIAPAEIPFALPPGWAWTRLGYVIGLVSGQHLQPSEYSHKEEVGLPYITGPADFSDSGLVITRWALVRKAVAHKGQILLTVKGAGVGKTAVCNLSEVAISRQLMALTPIGWNDRFLLLTTHRLAGELKGVARSLIPGISREDVDQFVMALPPLAEQARIVAKVDELMELCDRLEAAQTELEGGRDRLIAASLDRLNRSDTDPSTFRDHTRFHFKHLPHMTKRPDQVRQFRETILNFAIRGKLVKQDLDDEPAPELLQRIQTEMTRLARGKQVKRSRARPPVVDAEVPFMLPNGWCWARVEEVFTSVTDGDHLPPPKTTQGIPFLVIGNVRKQSLDFTGCRHVAVSYYEGLDKTRRPRMGDVLYTLVGSFGIPVVVRGNQPFCVQRHIGILRPSEHVSTDFLARALQSRFVFEQASICATGIAQKTVPLSGLRRMLLPIPPLNEQNRIVGAVDRLMMLCDQLEAQLGIVATQGRHLLEALLNEQGAPNHHLTSFS